MKHQEYLTRNSYLSTWGGLLNSKFLPHFSDITPTVAGHSIRTKYCIVVFILAQSTCRYTQLSNLALQHSHLWGENIHYTSKFTRQLIVNKTGTWRHPWFSALPAKFAIVPKYKLPTFSMSQMHVMKLAPLCPILLKAEEAYLHYRTVKLLYIFLAVC